MLGSVVVLLYTYMLHKSKWLFFSSLYTTHVVLKISSDCHISLSDQVHGTLDCGNMELHSFSDIPQVGLGQENPEPIVLPMNVFSLYIQV